MSTNNIDFQRSSQHGVGLIEVLVSLLLIAVAILGFSAMQLKAVQATDESMVRNRALTAIRGGSEMMRANTVQYQDAFQTTITDLLPESFDDIKTKFNASIDECRVESDTVTNFCDMEDLARVDATNLVFKARENEVKINMIDCPTDANPTTTKKCFITSWGDTEPTSVDSGTNNCIDTNGNYQPGATCFVMESY